MNLAAADAIKQKQNNASDCGKTRESISSERGLGFEIANLIIIKETGIRFFIQENLSVIKKYFYWR